jgi:hypothetical protein
MSAEVSSGSVDRGKYAWTLSIFCGAKHPNGIRIGSALLTAGWAVHVHKLFRANCKPCRTFWEPRLQLGIIGRFLGTGKKLKSSIAFDEIFFACARASHRPVHLINEELAVE